MTASAVKTVCAGRFCRLACAAALRRGRLTRRARPSRPSPLHGLLLLTGRDVSCMLFSLLFSARKEASASWEFGSLSNPDENSRFRRGQVDSSDETKAV